MIFRTRASQLKPRDLGIRAKHGYVAARRRANCSHSRRDAICRRLKIRVIASPNSTAARCPQIFAAGFDFNADFEQRCQNDICQAIDWRISGEQDTGSQERTSARQSQVLTFLPCCTGS
ncbi:MAG TPA: hypothetical protein VL361_29310 [Candidatus Limnocylindrales bacterium]|nr:hypothetical protein [Candidatus Limnocylindrales bacterium]